MARILLALAALVTALVPLVSPWGEFVMADAMAKGFAALGIALLLRGGLISIGHAMFFAAGAYVVAVLQSAFGIGDFFLLISLATLITTFFALVVGAFMVRYRGIFFAMLNLAVSMVLYTLLAKLYNVTGGTDGMQVPPPTFLGIALGASGTALAIYYATLVLVAVAGVMVHHYLQSPLGQALNAVHTNEVRLEYLGIPVCGVLLTAYTISGALAGLGGALMGMTVGHIVPSMAYWTQSGDLVLIAVLGGISGVAGPFAGSVFLQLVHAAAGLFTDAWNMITGIALLLVIFFLPGGLIGLIAGRRAVAK